MTDEKTETTQQLLDRLTVNISAKKKPAQYSGSNMRMKKFKGRPKKQVRFDGTQKA